MAVSRTHRHIVEQMRKSGALGKQSAILEIGEGNWYERMTMEDVFEEFGRYAVEPEVRDRALAKIPSIMAKDEEARFDLVKLFYEVMYDAVEVQAIDFWGTDIAQRMDLNEPVTLNRRFDVVINHGTAEHIFNIGQVFKTMHDYTVPGGVMIHESPFTGWVEHGFYNLQPTLYFDMAEANAYNIYCMCVEDFKSNTLVQIHKREDVLDYLADGRIASDTMLMTVLGKGQRETPFRYPIQGYYRKALSDQSKAAWEYRG